MWDTVNCVTASYTVYGERKEIVLFNDPLNTF